VTGTLAQVAGVAEGDEVLAVDGEPVRSMTEVRWRLLKIAVDHGRAEMTLRRPSGATHDVTLNLASISEADLQADFLERAGLTVQMPPAVIEAVVHGGAADQAGLIAGDEVVAAGGKSTPYVGDFVHAVRDSGGKSVALSVRRGDRVLDFVLVPRLASIEGQEGKSKVWQVGAQMRPATGVLVQYGPIAAFGHAVQQTWEFSGFSLRMLGKMIAGEISLKNLSGPVTIAEYAGESAQHGVIVFLSFLAFISTTIGLMNLLPIPLLDGGHLLYHFVEIVRGRPLSERFLLLSQRVGTIVLAGLMGLALFNDFSRLLS
jgi:regulator of sigma E protease